MLRKFSILLAFILIILLGLIIAVCDSIPLPKSDLVRNAKNPTIRTKRAFAYDAKLWEKGIVHYEFESGFPKNHKTKVEIAMNTISNATCIKFKPKTGDAKNYVSFKDRSDRFGACYSQLGQRGGRQYFEMTIEVCGREEIYTGIVVHELFHLLGFWHEFQRPQRSKYIEFHKDRLIPAYDDFFIEHNMVERPKDKTLNVPFNFDSIMQYNPQLEGMTYENKTGKYMEYVFTEVKPLPTGAEKPLGKFKHMGHRLCWISKGDLQLVANAYYKECGLSEPPRRMKSVRIPGTECSLDPNTKLTDDEIER